MPESVFVPDPDFGFGLSSLQAVKTPRAKQETMHNFKFITRLL